MPYELHKLLKEALETFVKNKNIMLEKLNNGYCTEFVHYLLTETNLTKLVQDIKVVEWYLYHTFLVIKPDMVGAVYYIVDSDTISHCYMEYNKENEHKHYTHFIETYAEDVKLEKDSNIDKKEIFYTEWLNNIERRNHG